MNIQQIITAISSEVVGFYQRSFGVIVLAGCVSVGLFLPATSAVAVKSCPDGGICGIDCDCNTDAPNESPPPPSSPFALDNTGKEEGSTERALSKPVLIPHTQPGGTVETREFRYSTPRFFKKRDNRSVNLWVVLHGKSQDAQRMHKWFKVIPHRAPTVLVYPEALYINSDNSLKASSNDDEDKKWRQPRRPEQVSDRDAFRDVVFIEWLVAQLLENNPQLHPGRVYVTGFSSGAGLTWTLLCYRSQPFKGFAMYSQQLGSPRSRGGCGDGHLPPPDNGPTGFERLTGQQADLYGFKVGNGLGSPQRAPTKAVFYAHGTADKLAYTGTPGCSEVGTCDLLDDPLNSMDPGGPLQDRDDKSSVNWLIGRHQLPSQPASQHTIPDEDPNAGDDDVTTCAHLYKGDEVPTENTRRAAIANPNPNPNQNAPSISGICLDIYASSSIGTGVIVQVTGAPVLWYEMIGGGHSISALAQGAADDRSKDYDASVHTQRFFQDYADMLR